MALADYRLCDVCNSKCFYDSNLNYEFLEDADYHWTDKNKRDGFRLDYLGDWGVICEACSEKWEVVIQTKNNRGETK